MESGKLLHSETKISFKLGFISDVGNVRTNNEDSLLVYLRPDPVVGLAVDGLFAVADGMGGHSGGEVASNFVTSYLKKNLMNRTFNSENEILTTLRSAVEKANFELYRLARRQKELSDMGTTLTCALIVGEKAYLAQVGDSRCYLVRHGKLTLLTEDHSWVAEEVRAGRLSPEKARTHPKKNIITRSVGFESRVEVDMQELGLEPGDFLLLASDGLTNFIEDRELKETLKNTTNPQTAAQSLIDLAKARGGDDNITTIIVQAADPGSETAVSMIEVTESAVGETSIEEKSVHKYSKKSPKAVKIVLTILAGLLLIGLSFFAGYSFHGWQTKQVKTKPTTEQRR
jgi:protein phosphatase